MRDAIWQTLLLVTGAFVACQSSPPPLAPTETTSKPPASPSAAPSASPSPSGSAAGSAAPSGSTCGGSGKCTGNVGAPLVEALSLVAKKAHRCYDNALATDPKLRGKVTVRVRLGSDGSVCDSRAEGDGAMKSVADCMANYYRFAALPAPDGGCADVVVPINLVPRSDDAGAPR